MTTLTAKGATADVVFVTTDGTAVALLFENVLMNDAIHVNRQDQKLQSWTDKHFYTLTDTVSQEEEAALWKSDDCILRMKSVVDAFEEAYGYCVYGQQHRLIPHLSDTNALQAVALGRRPQRDKER